MRYNNRPVNFVLFGYYGFGNLGDELLASSLASELLTLGYNKETLRILVGRDSSTAKALGIIPLFRRNIMANIKTFLKTKVFLFGGGGIFQDENGIKSCLYYLIYEIIAKLCGCKIYMIGQSIGPLHSKAGELLTNIAYKLANTVTVRDKASKNYLDKISVKNSLHSDLVLLLNNFDAKLGQENRNCLLLNVRDRYDRLCELTAKKALEFASENGLTLKYVAFSSDDKAEFDKLMERGLLPKQEVAVVENMADFKQIAWSASHAIGMRLHFCILSLAYGLFLCPCPYNPKVENFASEYGLSLLTEDKTVIFKQMSLTDLDKLKSEKFLLEQILTHI